MGNRVGELVVDWDALEVGDQAVFEGFTEPSNWRYTVGETYTVMIDDVGDKGFIEDVNGMGGTSGCPVRHLERFLFRLTHKVSDAVEEKVEQSFPDFPFKIRNGNKPEVRQWLKDNGVVWDDDGDSTDVDDYLVEREFLFINECTAETCDTEDFFNSQPEQEISINIQPAVVTGWEIVENVSEKELQLKEKIAKLTTELEEAQVELNNL